MLQVVFRKEFRDMVTSKRLLILIGLFILFYVSGFFLLSSLGLTNIRRPIIFFLRSYSSMISLIAPLLGIAFGYDSIAGEREKGTLKIILAQPIYRDTLILGKVFAFIAITSLSIYASTFISLGVFAALFGGNIGIEEVTRVLIVSLAAVLLSLIYYSISLLFSVLVKKSSQSALLSIAVWVILVVILPLVATMVAFAVVGPPPRIRIGQPGANPKPGEMAKALREWSKKFNAVQSRVMSVSPNSYFDKVVGTLFRIVEGRLISIQDALTVLATSFAVLTITPAIFLVLAFILFVKREEK